MNKEILFCQYCDKEVEVEYRKQNVISKINGESIELELQIPYCKECERELSNNDLEDYRYEMLYKEYRERKGLLQPEEIKRIREKYKLSQRAFSRVLGFAESTINRYELGAIQDNTNNSLIKLADNPENMKMLLMQNKKNLSTVEILKLEKIIKVLLEEKRKEENSIENSLEIILEKVTQNEKRIDVINKKVDVISKKIDITRDSEKYGLSYTKKRLNTDRWAITA